MATQPRTLYQLYIELEGVQPTVWRRLLLPATIKLDQLHPILQAAMGWQDSHYHCFIAAEQQYFCENQLIQQGFDEWQEESTTCLQEVLTAARPELIYEYDFGDGWRHRILLEKTLPLIGAEPGEPQCLSGEHACPPESCGGPPGYEQLVAILKDPRHDEHRELCDWLGTDSFDPTRFDKESVNIRLRAIHRYSRLLVHDEVFAVFKSVQPEIDRLLEQAEFESADMKQAFIDQYLIHITSNEGQPPVELPMPPNQLHQLLYQPFAAPEVLQLNPAVATLENSPLLALFKTLAECTGENGIKLTKKGNLPLAVVRSMVDAIDPDRLHYDRFVWRRGYRSEEDVPPVHYSRIIATVSGLFRESKGKLQLTRKGQAMLKKEDWASAFDTLMQGLFTQFNWAYVDHYPALPSLRLTTPVLLYRLHREQGKLRSIEAANYLLALFPHLLTELEEEEPQAFQKPRETFAEVMKHRLATLLPLAGLIEFERADIPLRLERPDPWLELTRLGKEYLRWQV
ncbi:MAG: plasmid pRiA4b ORF-3 family protein [Pseudomonadota bacterium]|nr:plasmid pRiA4b ORF-3 family protein [Pseudomonadota bacterium]